MIEEKTISLKEAEEIIKGDFKNKEHTKQSIEKEDYKFLNYDELVSDWRNGFPKKKSTKKKK